MHNFFKEAVNVSHWNLIQNENNLTSTLPQVSDDIIWVGSTKKLLDSNKFKGAAKSYFMHYSCVVIVVIVGNFFRGQLS